MNLEQTSAELHVFPALEDHASVISIQRRPEIEGLALSQRPLAAHMSRRHAERDSAARGSRAGHREAGASPSPPE